MVIHEYKMLLNTEVCLFLSFQTQLLSPRLCEVSVCDGANDLQIWNVTASM